MTNTLKMYKYTIVLSILLITEISLAIYLSIWREYFWNIVVEKNVTQFIHLILIFTGVSLALCFVTGLTTYLINISSISYREILNLKVRTKWIRRDKDKIENFAQRQQADCMDYSNLLFIIFYGLIKSIIYIVTFSIVLGNLYGYSYLILLYTYGLLGSYIAKKIAYPLISLNYQTQKLEASYRDNLTKANFLSCISVQFLIAKKQKYLSYFQSFYGQMAVLVPFFIIAPSYLEGAMTVGLLMRFNGTAATILENISYGVNQFSDINKLLSCRKRLKEIDTFKL